MKGTRPGSELYKIWETVGAVGHGEEMFQPDQLFTSELNGERITLWRDVARTEQELFALSPKDKDAIRDLMFWVRVASYAQIPADKPPELTNLSGYRKLKGDLKETMKVIKHYKKQDMADLMASFQHPLIRCMLSDLCPPASLANSFPLTYGNFLAGDGGIPRGGSRAMAARIQKRFEELGGTCFTGTPVQEIVHEAGRASGVRLENDTFVPADFIICACDPAITFGRLLDLYYMGPALRDMYKIQRPIRSTVRSRPPTLWTAPKTLGRRSHTGLLRPLRRKMDGHAYGGPELCV
jgi:phytoene dehydrogenase-like protein